MSLITKTMQMLIYLTKMKASHTVESQEAERSGCFSRALRRIAKRRQALREAFPYVIGVVALADTYEYIGGKLLYIVESRPRRWLRILDLRGSGNTEQVVDIPTLISTAIPRSAKSRKYKFRILYHSNGITSCLFSFALPQTENWLLIFKAQEQRIIGKILLESTSRIFVRNNDHYLYYGTHSEDGADGHRKWAIRGFNIRNGICFPQKLHLSNLVGYELGTNVCFEIIDSHFYGVSNQTAFEVEEIDWTSYYYCFRFRLDEPDPKRPQIMKRHDSWRRQHSEGPIDDRWGFLQLEKDSSSGDIRIIECRKEWPRGQTVSRRTYYTTKVVFWQEPNDGSHESSQARENTLIDEELATISGQPIYSPDLTLRPRLACSLCPGDENPATPVATRSATFLSSYQHSCDTFYDLFNNASSRGSDSQYISLRSGYRRLKLPFRSGLETITAENELDLKHAIEQLYEPTRVSTFPPEQIPLGMNCSLDEIYGILNPPEHRGYVTATADEHSILYATAADTNGLKALVYLSFDAAARLDGMKPVFAAWARCDSHHKTNRPTIIEGRESRGRSRPHVDGAGLYADEGESHTDESDSTPVLSSSTTSSTPSACILSNLEGRTASWAWIERPMHHELPNKLAFSRFSH